MWQFCVVKWKKLFVVYWVIWKTFNSIAIRMAYIQFDIAYEKQ